MNLKSEKKPLLKDNKLPTLHPSASLLLMSMFILVLYFSAIRPFIISTMTTVPVELVAAALLIICICVTVLILFFTLLLTLFNFIKKRDSFSLKLWTLKLKRQLSFEISFLLIFAVLIIFTQWFSYTPKILGADRKPLSGSIASLEKVDLGGSKQWVTIRGNKSDNPVLLFLSGGPGGSQLAATRDNLKKLEEHFLVVNWDQPGSGKSYHALPLKSITPERYVSDAYELTQYLCKRFNQKKIYVMGESWGSTLGIMLIQQHPELFLGFIGTGQMVVFSETETYCYEKAMEIAQQKGDTKKVEELKSQGKPPYYGKDMVWKESAYLMYLSDYMTKNPEITNSGYNTLGDISAPEYGLYDKVNYMRGVVTTFNQVYQELYGIDLRKQAVKLDVPVYFFEGRYDINAPTALVEDYFNKLEVPSKELIWFEHSGHSPWINERDKFNELVIKYFSIRNN